MLETNLCQSNFIDQQIKSYLHAQFSDKKHKESSDSTYVSYYELPYTANLSTKIKQKIIKLSNIVTIPAKVLIPKLSFHSLKLVGNLFSVKETVPK